MEHFGEYKTYKTLQENFFCTHMKRGVHHICIIDRFSRIAHFIPCHKVDDAYVVANIFFKEVVRLHDLSKTIISDRDSKTLWSKFSIKLLFSTTYHPQANEQTKGSQHHYILPPFELVYGFNPLTPLDLLSLPNVIATLNCDEVSKSQFVKNLYAKARFHIEKRLNNMLIWLRRVKHKKFEEGPLVIPSPLFVTTLESYGTSMEEERPISSHFEGVMCICWMSKW
ncbi:hypothetical protein CR513_14287, partial [Mucuna pruriens]